MRKFQVFPVVFSIRYIENSRGTPPDRWLPRCSYTTVFRRFYGSRARIFGVFTDENEPVIKILGIKVLKSVTAAGDGTHCSLMSATDCASRYGYTTAA